MAQLVRNSGPAPCKVLLSPGPPSVHWTPEAQEGAPIRRDTGQAEAQEGREQYSNRERLLYPTLSALTSCIS